MTNPVTAARYDARDGTEHRVLVGRSPQGGWCVLDRTPDGVTIVDTLSSDERSEQVAALARDYATEQQAFHDGERLDEPLPRPAHNASEESAWAA